METVIADSERAREAKHDREIDALKKKFTLLRDYTVKAKNLLIEYVDDAGMPYTLYTFPTLGLVRASADEISLQEVTDLVIEKYATQEKDEGKVFKREKNWRKISDNLKRFGMF